MARIITKEHAIRIREKLCGDEKPKTNGGHNVYAVRYLGKVIGEVSIRHGSEKDQGHDFIPRALNISPHLAKEIGQCTKNMPEFLACLRAKGLLPDEPTIEETKALPQAKSPWKEVDWLALQQAQEPEPPEEE